jgi:S1-C subfamily serine protease
MIRDPLIRIKQATVAIVLSHPGHGSQPFTIVGSGFCIDPNGLVVTCEHVLSSFMKVPVHTALAHAKKGEWDEPSGAELDTLTPSVMFLLSGSHGVELMFPLVRPASVMVKSDHDIGMIRLHPHKSYPGGFPYIEIASYDEIREGQEIGACGFPLGNYLYERVGTVSSSFTKGIVSSIIPTSGVHLDYLKGFQLNLFATHGSSGGPVFVYESGRVFGAIESDVIGRDGKPIQSLVKAAPIYPVLENDSIHRMLDAPLGELPEK